MKKGGNKAKWSNEKVAEARNSALLKIACIDPIRRTKKKLMNEVLPLVKEVIPADMLQLLERINEDKFVKYYDDGRPPVEITLKTGYTAWVLKNQRFLLINRTDDKRLIGCGVSGELGMQKGQTREEEVEFVRLNDLDEKSLIIYPLLRPDRQLGTLKFCDFSSESAFTLEQISIIHPLCQAVVSLLHTYNLWQDLEKTNDELKAVNGDLDEMVERFKLGGNMAVGTRMALMQLHDVSGLLTRLKGAHERAIFEIGLFRLSTGVRNRLIKLITKMDKTITELSYRINRGLRTGFGKPEQAYLSAHNLKTMIEKSLEKHQELFDSKRIKAQRVLGKANVLVIVDKHMIAEVLDILINNAVRAIEDQKPNVGRIKVLAKRDRGFISVSIQDNGCGIEPSNIQRIWQPYYTIDPIRRHGLGLYIAKRFIEELMGELHIASTYLHKGSTFVFELPIAENVMSGKRKV